MPASSQGTAIFPQRENPIEDLHAGKHSDLLDDAALSRITDAEMKSIMIAACEKLEELLTLKENSADSYYAILKEYNNRYCGKWKR